MIRYLKFILVIFFFILVLSACTRYPDEDWHITNEELFIEYYQKYLDYAIEVVDSYSIEYDYTIDLIETQKKNMTIRYYKLKYNFNDVYKLTAVFGHNEYDSGFNSGYISLHLETEVEEFEELKSIDYNYFEIMHKINEFSTYNLHGDINTYIELFNEMIDDNGISKSYYYHKEPYDGYYVNTFNYNGKIRFVFDFSGRLTNKNIWDKGM